MSVTRNSLALLILLAFLVPGLSHGQEVASALDWQALLAQARVSSPTLGDTARSLAAARESADKAQAFWGSSLSLTGKYSGELGDGSDRGDSGAGAAAASNTGTDGTTSSSTYTASLSIKPLEQLGVESSLSSDLALKVSATLTPFASTSQVDTARNNFSDEELRAAYNRENALRNLRNLYGIWAKSRGSLTSAILDRDIKARALKTEEIKYEAGAGSAASLDEASSNYLDAYKAVLDQGLAEEKARFEVLMAAGLDMATQLADPAVPDSTALEVRTAQIIELKESPRASLDSELAKRAWQRAQVAASSLPGFLEGLSFGGGLNASLADDASSANTWNASVSFKLGADTFSGTEASSRERSLESASASYRKAQAQASLDERIAWVNLESAQSMVALTRGLHDQSKAKYQAQLIMAETGSTSTAAVEQAASSLAKARSALDSAIWDLEKALQAWD